MTRQGLLAGRRVLVATAGCPHPTKGASTVLFFEYIRALARHGAPLLHVVLLDASNDEPALLSEYEGAIRTCGDVDVLVCRQEGAAWRSRGLARRVEVPGLPAGVEARLRAFAPEVVVCFDVLCAAAVRSSGLPGPRVVWLGDLYFQTFWYNALYDARESLKAMLRLPLNLLASVAWKPFYRHALSGVRTVIVSSKSSEGRLADLGIRSRYLPYPWPDAMPALEGDAGAPPDVPTFLFFGALSGLGSRSALDFFLRRVYPRMLACWGEGGFRVRIAGSRELPAWARAAIAARREIEFLGFVEDLASLARRSHAVLAPIAVPVGNRSRVLTAMSMGCLTIAHVNTALGNPDLESGRNCLLADSAAGFMRHMRFAVERRREALEIGARARDTFLELFSPPNACGRFVAAVADAITGAKDGRP